MTVIPVDFGKEDRDIARKFASLMRLAEDRDADILAHPGKYLELAGQRLTEYELFIQKLWEALRLPWMMSITAPLGEPPDQLLPDTITIDRRDYEAFQAVKALINSRRE